MNAFDPSIEFLALMILAAFLLVLLSFRINKHEKTIIALIWVVYMCIILAMTIPPIFITSKKLTISEMLIYERPWNLMPFSLITKQFKNMLAGQGGAAKQFLGNVVMFIPAGFFPPIIFNNMRKWYTILIPGFIWSLFIELSQLILHLSNMGIRSFDTDDLILNTFGALLGFLIYKLVYVRTHTT